MYRVGRLKGHFELIVATSHTLDIVRRLGHEPEDASLRERDIALVELTQEVPGLRQRLERELDWPSF